MPDSPRNPKLWWTPKIGQSFKRATDITYIRLEGGFAYLTGVLLREGIAISMDGRGRALDNIFVERLWRSVKYEDVYLKGYASLPELLLGLTEYFAFYNSERPHQSLG